MPADVPSRPVTPPPPDYGRGPPVTGVDLECCGARMGWCGYRPDPLPAHIFKCGYCGRVRLIEVPTVSPRYLRGEFWGARACT